MTNPWIESLTPARLQEGIDWVSASRPELMDYAGGNAEFALWMAVVDQRMMKLIGLTSQDLADFPSRDLYEDGLTPREGVQACLAYNDLDDLLGGA